MIPPEDDDEFLAEETHYPRAPDHWTNHEDETSWINGPGEIPVDEDWEEEWKEAEWRHLDGPPEDFEGPDAVAF